MPLALTLLPALLIHHIRNSSKSNSKKQFPSCKKLFMWKVQKNGSALPSLVSRNLEGRDINITEEENDLIMWSAGGLYGGKSLSVRFSFRFILFIQ